jgi:cytochrome c oxidase cbb3-type subunit IV
MSLEAIDLNDARGFVLIAVFIGFVGICAWAWSSKRKKAFRDASRLPLEDDQPAAPETQTGGKE